MSLVIKVEIKNEKVESFYFKEIATSLHSSQWRKKVGEIAGLVYNFFEGEIYSWLLVKCIYPLMKSFPSSTAGIIIILVIVIINHSSGLSGTSENREASGEMK